MLEGYLLLEPDLAKDASAEVTVLLKAIDWAEEELARRGRALPEHLIVEALGFKIGNTDLKNLVSKPMLATTTWSLDVACYLNQNPVPADGQLCEGGEKPDPDEDECFGHYHEQATRLLR